MNRSASVVFAALVLLPVAAAHAQAAVQSETCVPLGANSTTQSPVQLYDSMVSCAAAGNYPVAIDYFALAGVYGRFDTYRVADQSAHQVVGVLKNAALGRIPAPAKVEFQKLAGQSYENPGKHSALCDHVKEVGPPSYFPSYMLSHGLDSAIAGLQGSTPPDLVSPFDADAAWKNATATYLGCR